MTKNGFTVRCRSKDSGRGSGMGTALGRKRNGRCRRGRDRQNRHQPAPGLDNGHKEVGRRGKYEYVGNRISLLRRPRESGRRRHA